MAKMKYWNGTTWEVTGTDADKVELKDNNDLFQANNVEDALVEIKQDFNSHKADDVQHITAAERTAWDAKISASLLTTKGDLLYHNGTGVARLPRGTTGQILKVKSDGSLEWGGLDVIQPTKPKAADFINRTAAPSTWYTVVDVTSGKGILSRVSYSTITSDILIENVTLRLTIDGTVQTIALSRNASRGLGGESGSVSCDCVFHTFFTSSMKIEVMHTHTSAGYLDVAVDYNLV